MDNKIEINNAYLTLGKHEILKNINIQFEKGKIHGIVGRNGSGKSMLFKCICGFIKLTEGEIFVDGKKIGEDVDFPEETGILIEAPGFMPYYSGYKNLKILANLSRKITNEDIRKALELVGLDPTDKRHIKKYSLGMKQRLGIAQAIMDHPKLYILDEPMNALDKEGVAEMRQLFAKLRDEGKTILITSHNFEDIEILCDNIYEMEKSVMRKVEMGVTRRRYNEIY